MKNKKRTWEDFKVIKVKLNPEQAVLTCCQNAPRLSTSGTPQCDAGPCPGGFMGNAAIS